MGNKHLVGGPERAALRRIFRAPAVRRTCSVLVMLGSVAVLAAAEPVTLTGTWNMGLQGDHVVPTALVLKQDGKTLTGTIAMPTQNIGQRVEVELTGEVADGALKLSGAVDHAVDPTTITITGTLKDDGTLEGKLSMRDHNVTWTAERLKERK